ncbi:NAD(P)H-binding protein [uncultured Winogradskyella sp.]|uniref:NAD(P)H-binding protein n=1 Tax=uncultured Winogradskyella sp. TaxID=395353 RepID=UPI002627A34A|nr:NAD(P)H-binding protein [uncultured Winogradskyella sp.]
MKKQISVIGCGWLGLPLATFLIDEGFKVRGSTTSENKLELLKKHAIEGFIIRLNEDGISGNYSECLKGSEIVIINIPPGLRRNTDKNHVAELSHLIKAIEAHRVENVLYVSSTSVFKDESHFPIITDLTAPNATSNSSKQLIEIEQKLQNNSNFNTTILRFSGLFDKDRHPAKYLSGKTGVSNPDAPINLIHKEDCIQIITAIIKNQLWSIALNASYPKHPNKKEYYSEFCKLHDLSLPEFNSAEKSKGKIIDSTKLVQLLNYTFKQAP